MMLFNKLNKELDLAGLNDFIEKPAQNCNEEELKNGVSKLIPILSKNPAAIMNIIANHPVIHATFLLDDLVEKMKKRNCLNELFILFDKCLDDLVEACIYNPSDLDRCLEAFPKYSDKVIQNILSNENRVKRILEADKDPEGTLKKIVEKYPDYKNQFSEFYSKHFNSSPKKKI